MPKKSPTEERRKLRAAAEARFVREPPPAIPAGSVSAHLHELQVHQIELEMQNEELRRSRLELEEAHGRLVDLYDFAPVGYLTLDGDGVIISANLTAANLLGVDRGSLVRRRFPGFVAGTDGDRWHRAFLALLQHEDDANHRLTLRRGDGTTFDADLACARRSGHDGTRVRVTFADVTEVARTARELQEIRERLSLVIDSTGVGYTDWDIPSGRVKYSRRFAILLGYDIGEFAPTLATWEGLVHPDDKHRVCDSAKAHLRGETAQCEWEARLRHKDGRWLWMKAVGGIVARDRRGSPIRFVGTHADITERKRAEQALVLSEAKYRGLFESLKDGFVLVDMDGNVRESNETYRAMVGYSAEELQQKTYRDLTPEHWHDAERRIVEEQVLPRGFSDVYEKQYRRKDGTVFPVELRTFLLKDMERPVAMWAIVRDLTETRAFRARLALASRLAALGTLVTGVAHEINNPLAAEMADQGLALEVVREVREHLRDSSRLDKEADGRALDGVVEALEDARESAERISRIVMDLTLFGKPDAKRQRVRLMDIVGGAVRWLPASVARSASIHVEDRGAPDVLASAGQIEQVLVNLITNAAKATPEGRLDTVIVRVGPGAPGMARVEVIDHGVGIAPSLRDRIFDPFFTTRPVGPARGTGLGLAISQAITTSHGGTLTFESEMGQGSTFRLELPAAPPEA